jgi:hypothetical protein
MQSCNQEAGLMPKFFSAKLKVVLRYNPLVIKRLFIFDDWNFSGRIEMGIDFLAVRLARKNWKRKAFCFIESA